MNKYDFIEYAAKRYGVDNSVAETLVDMFGSCLQELLHCGQSVEIDGVGKFERISLFPGGLNHQNNIALFKAAKRNMVYFKASDDLIENIA